MEEIEERDLKRTPLAVSSVSTSQLDKNCARGTMKEEDIRMPKKIKNILKDDCLNFSNKQRPVLIKLRNSQERNRRGKRFM